MADDARISTAFPRHPKTVKLHRRLGAQGCWSLICLFLWVADNRPDGNLHNMTTEDIAIAADWPGESEKFVGTLAEIRFLDGQDGSYRIHEWAEHNPWAAGRPGRIENARFAAKNRWAKRHGTKKPDVCEAHKAAMPPACEAHETAMPTSPHHTSSLNHNKSLARSSLAETEEIYECYPRKVGRKVALKAIGQAIRRVQEGEYGKTFSRDEAVAGIKQRTLLFAESPAGKRGTFTPHAATWFNRSSYLDDPKEWEQNDSGAAAERSRRTRENILVGLGLGAPAGGSC